MVPKLRHIFCKIPLLATLDALCLPGSHNPLNKAAGARPEPSSKGQLFWPEYRQKDVKKQAVESINDPG